MFQHCLICTDFSDGLHRLTDFVPDLAKSGLKRLVFLHCISVWQGGRVSGVSEDKIAAAKGRFDKALTSIPAGVEVKIEVVVGNPVEQIRQAIKSYQIDIVFVGTPIRSLLEEKMVGSTSAQLAKALAVPLMVLRPQLITTYTHEELALRCQHLWRYLLVPYNDSTAARYLVERVKEYAKKQPEQCTKQCLLLWVVEDGLRDKVIAQNRLQEAQKKLATVKTDLESVGLEVTTEVRQGNPLLEILDVALYYDITAIALGSDRQPDWLELAVHSFAKDLLRRSWFPVLYFSNCQ